MTLTLTVDGDRWRRHLRAVADANPGLVPVAKGNGYGFGLARLARKAQWLGVDTIAVGTYEELPEVASRFDGDLLVLTPWRPFVPSDLDPALAKRVVHTVGRVEDVAGLLDRQPDARFVLERLTSMNRHGFSARDLRGITDTLDSDDPHVGLIQFKVGTGGEAVEYAGEWDLPINRAIYKAFELDMGRR
jgi:alanine racemase